MKNEGGVENMILTENNKTKSIIQDKT